MPDKPVFAKREFQSGHEVAEDHAEFTRAEAGWLKPDGLWFCAKDMGYVPSAVNMESTYRNMLGQWASHIVRRWVARAANKNIDDVWNSLSRSNIAVDNLGRP